MGIYSFESHKWNRIPTEVHTVCNLLQVIHICQPRYTRRFWNILQPPCLEFFCVTLIYSTSQRIDKEKLRPQVLPVLSLALRNCGWDQHAHAVDWRMSLALPFPSRPVLPAKALSSPGHVPHTS